MTRVNYSWEHSEVALLAANLVGNDICGDVRNAVVKATQTLTKTWQANATVSAGKHGKLYPRTIEGEVTSAVGGGTCDHTGEIKPRAGMPQSGMAFEYGGPSVIRNPSPSGRGGRLGQRVGQTGPHLDMNRAADIVFPAFHRDVAALAEVKL